MSTDPKKHDELSDEDMEQVTGACGEVGSGGQQTDEVCWGSQVRKINKDDIEAL